MTKEEINNRSIQAINWLLESNAGLTKTALADSFAIKPAKFSEILNGRMNVGTEIMAALCANHNISSDWLLTGRGEMLRNERPEQAQEMTIYNRDPRDIAMIELQSKQIALLEDKVRLLEHNANPFDTSNFTRVPYVPYNQDAVYADRDKSPKRAPKEPQK